MVVFITSLPHVGEIYLYDNVTDVYEKICFEVTLQYWEINKVDEYFKKVRTVVKKPIDRFYIILNWTYLNDIRKKIAEAAKNPWYYIENCYIISTFVAAATVASKCVSTNSLWIFCWIRMHFFCMLWEKDKYDIFQCKHIIYQACPDAYTEPTTECLLDLKKQMNEFNEGSSATSVLVVLQKSELINRENFLTVFQDQKDIIFKFVDGFAYEFLQTYNYAEKLYEVLGRFLYIKNSNLLAEFHITDIVPFTHHIEVNFEYGDTILKVRSKKV
jgi:hypothetical protein